MEDERETVEYQIHNNSDVERDILLAAQKHYDQGNYSEALKLLLDSISVNTDSKTYVDIGSCYFKLKKYSDALGYWNRAVDIDPGNSSAYANMGNLYYANGQIEKAISLWLVALISRPEDATTSLNLAIAYNGKNMRFESIKYFERYLKYCENKSNDEYRQIKEKIQHCYFVANEYLTLGAGFHNENKEEKAAACYFKSLANYPNLAKTNLNLGSIFFSDKNLELAIKYWKAASHIDRTHIKTYSNLAISYDMKREFDYAYCYYHRYMDYVIGDKEEYYKANNRLVKLKPFLNEHPELIEIHLKRAEAHIANNAIDDAIDEFKNYSILNPAETVKYKDIIKKLESYLNPELEIISSCFDKGNALITRGKYSEAKPYFFRVMQLSSPQYLEFTKAKAKYTQCDKVEMES